MFSQKDMPDLRIEPATSCTAVERGYDRASQAGVYFTMTLEKRTNGYDQDLCVLAKNSLIWIYTVFYAYTWPFRLSTMWYIIPRHNNNVVYYPPPQVSGGVLCFPVGCPCVCPSVRILYVRPSALHFRSIAEVFMNGFH